MDPADRRHEALIEAGLALASDLSLPSLLQRIVELATSVADARYGALGVLGPDGESIEEFVTYGVTEEERRAIGHLPRGKGLLGALIHDAKPLRLRRIQDDARSVGFPPNHPPMGSFLGVPVKVRGRVYGNLYLTEKRGADEFTEADERAVITLAAQAAVAIENARLYEEVERLAVLEDRERIAKDLHDGVVQSLFAVGMGLEAAGMHSTDERVQERLSSAVDDIDRVIRELRDYIFGLRPGAAADRDLARAIRDVAERFAAQSGLAVSTEIDPAASSLLSALASDVVQMTREAVANAIRHSGAELVVIRLTPDDGELVLEIEDDGKGFDPRAVRRGHGLENIERRAEAVGGALEIDSRAGTGTSVRVRLPERFGGAPAPGT